MVNKQLRHVWVTNEGNRLLELNGSTLVVHVYEATPAVGQDLAAAIQEAVALIAALPAAPEAPGK